MINRTLLRVKVVQILYSFYHSSPVSLDKVEKELFFSLNKTYEMYCLFFKLLLELWNYEVSLNEKRKKKLLPTNSDLNPRQKFMNNRFLLQLSENITLNNFFEEGKSGWSEHDVLIKDLYILLTTKSFFENYLSEDSSSYIDDKNICIQIIKKIFSTSESLGEIFEEMSIYWNDDADTVMSFVIKTIKQFDETKGAEQALLPLSKEDDLLFVKELLHKSILHGENYRKVIDSYAKNWDADRLAFMDVIILQVAMVELLEMDNIPYKVTMNEYIEISKSYSTEKSATFINGILDRVVKVNILENNNS